MSCDHVGARLDVRNISYGPDKDLTLIRNITFSIGSGDRLAIVGANGAGKSTLLRCLYRALKPTGGKVLLDGEDIWTQNPRETARKVAVVLQEMPADFPFSVRDIVMMGRIPRRTGFSGWTDKDRSEVAHALDHLSLQSMANRQFSTLSGGEKQRVLVARALAQEPEMIILDEPTNHLDIRHQLEILSMLKGLGLTVITSLHDMNLASDFATHVAILQGGIMTAFGAPAEVMTQTAISSAFGVCVQACTFAQAGLSGTNTRFFFNLNT
jgi:iron complex transport system ATP-binding protein